MKPVLQILALPSGLLKPLGASERRYTVLVGFQLDLVLRELRLKPIEQCVIFFFQMAEKVSGSFVFTILDVDNNSYFVKGDNPLALADL